LFFSSVRFVRRALAFEFLDRLTRRQVFADEAGVVVRVAVGPEDRIAAEASRGTRRSGGSRRRSALGGAIFRVVVASPFFADGASSGAATTATVASDRGVVAKTAARWQIRTGRNSMGVHRS
jgi:hypothetical protein